MGTMELEIYSLPIIIIVFSFIIAIFLNFILEKLRKRAEKTDTKLDDILLHALSKPLFVLIIVIGLYYAIHLTPYLGDTINKFDEGNKYRHFILTIFGTWVVASLAKRIIKDYGYEYAGRTEGELDDRLMAFADMSATYFIWLIGIMIALSGDRCSDNTNYNWYGYFRSGYCAGSSEPFLKCFWGCDNYSGSALQSR